MEVKIRRSKDNQWGFVEDYSRYRYGFTGSITITAGVSLDRTFVEPYVFRADDFVPLRVIDEEMGIEKYIRAKKPFYSRLCDGFIVKISAKLDYRTGELDVDKTTYCVYDIAKSDIQGDNGQLKLMRVLQIPEEVHNLVMELARLVAASKGDREVFLRSRIQKVDEKEGVTE